MSPAPVFSPARWAAGFLLLALSLLALGAHAQAVAVVTDVKGAVAFAPDRGTKPVALLSELTQLGNTSMRKSGFGCRKNGTEKRGLRAASPGGLTTRCVVDG